MVGLRSALDSWSRLGRPVPPELLEPEAAVNWIGDLTLQRRRGARACLRLQAGERLAPMSMGHVLSRAIEDGGKRAPDGWSGVGISNVVA